MAHPYNRFFATAVTLFSLASAFAAPSALKTINTPQGGQIVYGQVDGAASEAAAMGAVLRTVHNQFGDKPEVGKIFRVHGTSSVDAEYFPHLRFIAELVMNGAQHRTHGGGFAGGAVHLAVDDLAALRSVDGL